MCNSPKEIPASCPQDKNPIGYLTYTDSTSQATEHCFVLSENTEEDKSDTQWSFASVPSDTPVMQKAFINAIKIVGKDIEKKVGRLLATKFEVENDSTPTNHGDGIRIVGQNTNKNGGNDLLWDVQIEAKCITKTDPTSAVTATYDKTNQIYKLTLSHPDACGYDITGIWDELGNWRFLVGGVIAAACAVLVFLGWKLFKPTMCIVGMLAGGVLTYFVLNMFWDDYSGSYRIWVFLGVSVAAGIALALLLFYCMKLASFALGAFLGQAIGFMLYDLVLVRFVDGDTEGFDWILWSSVIGCALIFG